jgi:prepilin-type processing-associated H-X9-DG protein
MILRRLAKYRRSLGFSITEVLAVATMISTVPMGAYMRAKEKGAETECKSNLQEIGKALAIYINDNGEYPKAAFFPKEPKTGADSIRVLLPDIPEKLWICPSTPDALKEKGLTFVYNDSLGGKKEFSDPGKKWVLIEINCVSASAPAPHPTGYNVLFADGHVITTRRLPSKITDSQQAVLDRLQQELGPGVKVAMP